MAKGRMIDRKIRASQTFARFTYRQRDLWQGLIVMADDQGRLPGNPAYIRSIVWPYDDITLADTVADLEAIEAAGNLVRYIVNDCEYIQLVNWHTYQIEAAWLGKSDYPAPPGWIDHCRYHTKGNEIITENWETRGIPNKLPSTLPSTLPRREVNSDGEGDIDIDGKEEMTKKATATPIYQSGPEAVAERVYHLVTGHFTIPNGTDRPAAINVINKYVAAHGDEKTAADILRPYFVEWKRRKYHVTNLAWLTGWAATGEIPIEKGSNNGAKPDASEEYNRQRLAQIEAAKDAVLKDWRP